MPNSTKGKTDGDDGEYNEQGDEARSSDSEDTIVVQPKPRPIARLKLLEKGSRRPPPSPIVV